MPAGIGGAHRHGAAMSEPIKKYLAEAIETAILERIGRDRAGVFRAKLLTAD
jgi:hypothetical protein